MTKIKFVTGLSWVFCAVLSACVPKPPALYDWQGYQAQVDAYLRQESSDLQAQTQTMQEGLQKIQAASGVVPPGYYAHLGLLYGQMGDVDQFASYLQVEKDQYPESQVFMDFLLRNFKPNKDTL